MKAQRWLLGAVIVGITIALSWFWFASGDPRAGDALQKSAAIPVEKTPRSMTNTAIEPRDETATLRSSASELEAAPDAAEEPAEVETEVVKRWIEGRTLDPRGEPLGGVEVSPVQLVVPGEPVIVFAHSDGAGRFRFETELDRLTIHGSRPGFVTVYAANVPDDATDEEVRIVLAPFVELEGRVVDSDGQGIAGAWLRVGGDSPGLAGYPFSLDRNDSGLISVKSGKDGSFEFRSAPRIDGHELRVHAEGFTNASIEVPETSRYDFLITLERAEAAANPRIFGTVSLPNGTPAIGAKVECGYKRMTVDATGSFELVATFPSEFHEPVIARLEGWQSAVWHEQDPSQLAAQERGPLQLILPGRALSIRGRLELADGSPAEGWQFCLIEPRTPALPGQLDTGLPKLTPPRGSAVTDADGAFVIDGLGPGDVALRLWSLKPLDTFDAAPIAAGSQNVVLRVPGGTSYESLTGRVALRDGRPVAGAEVEVHFTFERSAKTWSYFTAGQTTTDEEGRFELKNVPRIGARLFVKGDELFEHTFTPADGDLGPGPLEIVMHRLVHVRIDAASLDPRPDVFRILDSSGEPLFLAVATGSSHVRDGMHSLALVAGASGVFTVPESAATLVLLRGDLEHHDELSRHAITLVPGDVNVLTP